MAGSLSRGVALQGGRVAVKRSGASRDSNSNQIQQSCHSFGLQQKQSLVVHCPECPKYHLNGLRLLAGEREAPCSPCRSPHMARGTSPLPRASVFFHQSPQAKGVIAGFVGGSAGLTHRWIDLASERLFLSLLEPPSIDACLVPPCGCPLRWRFGSPLATQPLEAKCPLNSPPSDSSDSRSAKISSPLEMRILTP